MGWEKFSLKIVIRPLQFLASVCVYVYLTQDRIIKSWAKLVFNQRRELSITFSSERDEFWCRIFVAAFFYLTSYFLRKVYFENFNNKLNLKMKRKLKIHTFVKVVRSFQKLSESLRSFQNVPEAF